jgi:hypothetical protein
MGEGWEEGEEKAFFSMPPLPPGERLGREDGFKPLNLNKCHSLLLSQRRRAEPVEVERGHKAFLGQSPSSPREGD